MYGTGVEAGGRVFALYEDGIHPGTQTKSELGFDRYGGWSCRHREKFLADYCRVFEAIPPQPQQPTRLVHGDSPERTRSVMGQRLNPIMPWDNYRHMNDEDLKAIFGYLRTVKPVENRAKRTANE
jgi:hypothetical protein